MNTQDRYKNKLFSVFGDSISTLEGYSEPDDAVFYEGLRRLESNVLFPEDTWWGQVIRHLGGELLVNNSFSGSMVSKHRNCIFPSYGCSGERTEALWRDGLSPDVIMVYLGTNDWGYGVKPTPETPSEEDDISVFSVAYKCMLEKLQKNYPQTEIWCFTLSVSDYKDREDFVFPYRYGGRHIEEYCDVIRACAEAYKCRVIDLYRSAPPYDTIDGFHPNAEGMKTLSDTVIGLLGKEDLL